MYILIFYFEFCISTKNYTFLVKNGGKSVYFGAATYKHSYNGYLDEVAIYNRILAEEEIKEHYDAGKLS